MPVQDMIERLKRHNPFTSADETFVRYLRDQGLSRVDSIRVIVQIFGLSLGKAKEVVHLSETWRAERASAEQLWDDLEEAARDIADGNWLAWYWRRQRLPLIPGVFQADGRIVKLDVKSRALPEPGRFAFDVSVSGETTLADLGRAPEELGNMTMLQRTVTDMNRNLSAYCGEGSWGGDGYIALVQADSNQPIWIAYFDESNPFVSVELSADCVIAVSNHGNRWSFPINAPEKVTVD